MVERLFKPVRNRELSGPEGETRPASKESIMIERAKGDHADSAPTADKAGDTDGPAADLPFLLDDFGASYLRGYRDPFVDAPAVEWSAA